MDAATIVNSESSTVPESGPAALLPLGGFHHIGITVCDVDASEAWYARVLGFERLMVEPHNGADGSALLMHRPGGHLHIGLDNHKANEGEPFAEHRTGLDHLAIHVDHREDLDRWAEHLDRLDVAHGPITGREEPFPFATLVFRDPDNVQLELIWA
jgi:glyoxylase I family protein